MTVIDPVQEAIERIARALSDLKDAERRVSIARAELGSALAYLKEVTK